MRRAWAWRSYDFKPPRRVAGGLKLRKARGDIAESWWGKKWIEVLDSFGWHTRLERGRRYARRGQVASLRVDPGLVSARVQGSRAKPYEVSIRLHAFSRKDWSKAAGALAKRAVFTAKLLAGEMPEGISEALRRSGLPLFPKSRRDLVTDCTCPDAMNPCKHVAAAYYLLAQEFDRDPFLLFTLRGISRENLLADIRGRRASGDPDPEPDSWRPEAEAAPAAGSKHHPKTALPVRPQDFFSSPAEIPCCGAGAESLAALPKPGAPARELGAPPFWRGEEDFPVALGRLYQAARERALRLAVPPSAPR